MHHSLHFTLTAQPSISTHSVMHLGSQLCSTELHYYFPDEQQHLFACLHASADAGMKRAEGIVKRQITTSILKAGKIYSNM